MRDAKYNQNTIVHFLYRVSPGERCVWPDILIVRRVLSLKFLRNFGHLISNLHVQFLTYHLDGVNVFANYNYKLIIIFLEYLCEYGSKSIIRLSLEQTHIPLLMNIKVPLTSVKVLRIQRCRMEGLYLINTLFPNLHTLNLGENYYVPNSTIQCHFPTVKCLAFNDDWYRFYTKAFERDDIEQLLRLNPQLEELKLTINHSFNSFDMCKDKKIFQCFPDYFPHLKHLELNNVGFRGFEIPSGICFDHIEHLSLLSTDFCQVPYFSVPKLKYLEVKDYQNFSRYSKTNEHLPTLKVIAFNNINVADFLKDNNLLMHIEELSIIIGNILNDYTKVIPSECILRFLRENRSLKKILIEGRPQVFNDILSALIISNSELKIRNKALEFLIERKSDRSLKKYVLRHVTWMHTQSCFKVDIMELTTFEESKIRPVLDTYDHYHAVEDMRNIWCAGIDRWQKIRKK